MHLRSAAAASLALCAASLALAGCDAPADRVLRTSNVPAPAAVAGRAPSCVAETPAPARGPSRWRVRRGDTLRSIARDVYGDERLWGEIARANPSAPREGALRAGAELTIPWDAR